MYVFLILTTWSLLVGAVDITSKNLSLTLNPEVIPAEYVQSYVKTVNSSIEYVFLYPEIDVSSIPNHTARINVQSNATSEKPLLVVVKQKKGILSWQIPLFIESKNTNTQWYNKTSRTLCSLKYYKQLNQIKLDNSNVIVSIFTSSELPVFFNLTVVLENDFYLGLGETREITISPSEPRYYGYSFSNQVESGSVLMKIESDSDTCMTVAIQNTTCPVFDLERNIQFSRYWQTVSQLGGITIPKEIYPSGFFVVLVLKGDDTDCTDQTGFYIIGVITHNVRLRRRLRQQLTDELETPSRPEELLTPEIEEAGPRYDDTLNDDSSLDEDDIDMLDDAFSDKEIIRTRKVLAVSDLARKDPKILRHKSRLYLYYLGTIAVFYALPVVQLVATYQNVLHVTGNQDLCYYNFLCSHPFFWFSDFNHKKSYGIPQHYGLFYAMGTALMMEGLLSACYHVCPNHSNFQFDTSFMYIISVLCMVKIYQTRHPDINARATVTFAVLALMIFLGTVGVLNDTDYFWIVFTLLHLIVCLSLTAQIYYMGRWRLDKGLVRRVIMVNIIFIAFTFRHDARAGVIHLLRPMYGGRLLLLVIANLCNVAIAVLGNMHHEKDFATFLLAVLMLNLLLYTFFYIVMKLCYRERILLQPLCYIILSFITWGFALYFFINKSVSWSLLPAQSRRYNMPCKLLNFFDFHDIWHFLSALAMFFSFMVLLTLDDDLEDTHRSQIPIF
ncbi:GSCOCG00003211001-RA-CDS [Cotesia congregata]|nr:GSCOCG00003211001-RA-CDS [Cotesia congregata]